jgi:hypothetical protein
VSIALDDLVVRSSPVIVSRSGQPITRFFLSLPSRLQYPDYYKVIQRPVALDAIEDKVSRKDYVNPYALVSDLRQMVENAQYYNEEGSEVWEAAEEIRQYVEGTTIPTLLADGFTLDPNDLRQSALPVDIMANSTVPAQAAAYRIQVERRKALENGTSTEMLDSVSPEMTSKTLAQPTEHSFKIRLSNRANAASASPAALGEIQPPGIAPSNSGLGLSVNHQGARLPSQGTYSQALPTATSATPTSYLTTNLPPNAINGSSWQANKVNGVNAMPSAQASNPYFAAALPNHSGQPSLQSRNSFTSSSMAPPAAAAYMNGSSPYQKSTNVQLQESPTDPSILATQAVNGNATPRTSQHLSKRLQGEGPAFDPFKTNVLQVDADTTIVRNAVISQFNVKVESKNKAWKSLAYRLTNDVTRIHSVNLSLEPSEQWECTVDMTPRDIVSKETAAGTEDSRQWTVSIHHNGKGIKPQGTTESGKESNGIVDTPGSTSRVQVDAGISCQFKFSPNPGANIISVHIHPPPPNSALQEIVKDEKHPLRSKAKALLDLPERYRILVYCRA